MQQAESRFLKHTIPHELSRLFTDPPVTCQTQNRGGIPKILQSNFGLR
jgi:hypothetical protein